MSINSLRFQRRNFLRGLGACVALPAFQSMLPSSALAAPVGEKALAATASGMPLRAAFICFPNGAIPGVWWPESEGKDFPLSQTLQPLEKVRDSIQIMKGLDIKSAVGGSDGGGDHARGNGTFLTGVRLNKSSTDIRCGISIDQAIANEIGHLTRFPSLELTCDERRQTSGCDSGYSCAYQYNISWKSVSTPMSPESSPRLLFERLFGTGEPGERIANMQRRRFEQRSVLDFVLDDARSMQKRLRQSDRLKLDEYLNGVREVESRIEKSERFGNSVDPNMATPAGGPLSHEEHVNLMYELMALAFQTDATRVGTLLLSHDGSNRSFDQIGIVEGHHDLTHHQNREDQMKKVAEIDRWYVLQFSKFLQRLESMKDVDGTSILHNSMIVYGSGNADGNRHTHSDIPVVMAGAAGGSLTTGRFVDYQSKPFTNLFLTIAQQFGVNLDRIGDSTAPLSNV